VYTFSYTAADGARRFQFPVTAQYFRNVYTNGAGSQTHMRMQTILHRQNQLTSIHRLSDDMSPDRSAQVMKAAIVARSAGAGDFKVLNATAGANLKVSVEEFDTTAALPAGTIQVDHNPIEPLTTYGTQGTTGAAVRGTLVTAVGAGTDLMVSGLSVVVESGTVDCAICFGTMLGPDGNDVLVRGQFVPGGGIARDYTIPLSKTNGTLTYYMGGAGTAYFQAQYWDE
jgi:hypothetical protein